LYICIPYLTFLVTQIAFVGPSPLENRSSTHFTTENSQCHALLAFACLLPAAHTTSVPITPSHFRVAILRVMEL